MPYHTRLSSVLCSINKRINEFMDGVMVLFRGWIKSPTLVIMVPGRKELSYLEETGSSKAHLPFLLA